MNTQHSYKSTLVSLEVLGELSSPVTHVVNADGLALEGATEVAALDGAAWTDGQYGEYVTLERQWIEALEALKASGGKEVAVISLATSKGFPVDRAAYVAFNAIFRFVAANEGTFDRVVLVAENQESFDGYKLAFDKVVRTMLG